MLSRGHCRALGLTLLRQVGHFLHRYALLKCSLLHAGVVAFSLWYYVLSSDPRLLLQLTSAVLNNNNLTGTLPSSWGNLKASFLLICMLQSPCPTRHKSSRHLCACFGRRSTCLQLPTQRVVLKQPRLLDAKLFHYLLEILCICVILSMVCKCRSVSIVYTVDATTVDAVGNNGSKKEQSLRDVAKLLGWSRSGKSHVKY